MENIILQTHGISVKYGNFLALDDVSISLKNKHIYGFIGENGAGKTTLMKVLTGLLYPTNGDCYFTDSNTLSFQKIRDKIRISVMISLQQ